MENKRVIPFKAIDDQNKIYAVHENYRVIRNGQKIYKTQDVNGLIDSVMRGYLCCGDNIFLVDRNNFKIIYYADISTGPFLSDRVVYNAVLDNSFLDFEKISECSHDKMLDFLKDKARYLVEADVLLNLKTISVKPKVSFRQTIMDDKTLSIAYTGPDEKGILKIPSVIRTKMPIFHGWNSYPVDWNVHVKVPNAEGKLKFSFNVIAKDALCDDVFRDIIDYVRAETPNIPFVDATI